MNKKQRSEISNKFYEEILRILVTERELKSPKMPRRELAEEFDVEPSTALRLENGTYRLDMARFFEWCLILGLDPVSVVTKAKSKVS
jgi:transcriptional regulator with XRE-family HTH domain